MSIADLMGFRVLSSSAVPADMVVMVRDAETLHRFIWTANALADQERELEALRRALAAAEAALVRAREALNHDRTGLATALNRIQSELRGRYWMRHEKDGGEAGSWGSYPYTQHTVETLRREISWAFGSIGTWAEKALNASGNLAGVEIRAMEEPIGLVRRALAPAPTPEAAAPRPSPWMDPNHAFGPPASDDPATNGCATCGVKGWPHYDKLPTGVWVCSPCHTALGSGACSPVPQPNERAARAGSAP